MHFIFSDGRLALRLENRKYDLILVDAPDPNIAYAGNLYSREFFEEARNGLAPGGLFCSYAPTERIRRTVVRVFPNVVSIHMPGFLHFMLGASERIDVTRGDLLKRLRNVKVRDYLSSTTLGESSYLEVRKLLRGARVTTIGPDDSDPRWRGDVNTDLFPRDEFDMTTVDQR